jgi:aldose 1-epimerase
MRFLRFLGYRGGAVHSSRRWIGIVPQTSQSVIPAVVTLRDGPFALDIAPEIGGAIVGLHVAWPTPSSPDGIEPLRRTSDAALAARDVRQAGSFAMLPYSNRMRECTLHFQGKRYRLAPNFGAHPHSIHGVGWQRAWTVESATATSATLRLEHGGAGNEAAEWPFAFVARQHFAMAADGFTIGLEIDNTGSGDMPAGFGLHPYFLRGAGTRLVASTQGVWRNDEAMMPVSLDPVPPAWNASDGKLVAALSVDNCFAGWDGTARIEWPEWNAALDMTADPVFGHLVVYVPAGKPFFCVEPASNRNDGINMLAKGRDDTGVVVLAPGARLAGEVRFKFSRLAP